MNDQLFIEYILTHPAELRAALGERWGEFLQMLDHHLQDRSANDRLKVFDIRRAIRTEFPELLPLFEAWLAAQEAEVELRDETSKGVQEDAPGRTGAETEASSLAETLDQLTGVVASALDPQEQAVAANGGPKAIPEPPARTVKTHPNLQGEDYAYLGKIYRLTVKLSDQPQTRPGSHIAAPEMEVPVEPGEQIKQIQVKLYAPDFELAAGEPGWLWELTFYVEAAASSPVTFSLIPQDRFETRYFATLKLQFLVQGQVIGEAYRRIEVLQAESTPKTPLNAFPQAPGYPLDERGEVRLEPVPTPVLYQESERPVDLTVTIQESDQPDRLLWDIVSPYLAETDFPPGPYYGPNRGTEEFVKTYLAPFGMPGDWPEDHMDSGGCLKPNSISLLFQNLIELRQSAPPQFWQLYETALERYLAAGGDRSPEDFTILFRTADTHIPWELMPVSDQVQGDKIPPLLGSAHRVGRWLLEVGRPTPQPELHLRGLALAAPTYMDDPLEEAQLERQFIEGRYRPFLIPDRPEALPEFMTSGQPTGGAGILHYAGHGDCCTDPLKGNWLVLTDRKAFYSARSASNDLGNKLGKLRPILAFFNACNVGRAAPGPLGSNGGWGRALLHQQYQGYVGPLWSVYDKHAREIAETFYTLALDEGLPLGEVMRRVRARFSQDNRLFTYLAYLYLGHPLARITYEPYPEQFNG